MIKLLHHLEELTCTSCDYNDCNLYLLFKTKDYEIQLPNYIPSISHWKKLILDFILKNDNTGNVKQQMRVLQLSIIDTLNNLYNNQSSCKYKTQCANIIGNPHLQILINLFDFIKCRFPNYFDAKLKLPNIIVERERKKSVIDKNWLIMNNQFFNDLHVLLKPFIQLAVCKNSKFTYKRIAYLNLVAPKLKKVLSKFAEKDQLLEEIIKTFIVYNYNYPPCYTFITEKMTERLAEESTDESRSNMLTQYEKRIQQLPQCTTEQYSYKYESLKSNILNWIQQELKYTAFKMNTVTTPISNKTIIKPAPEKIKTNLSVPQIACLLRQFMEAKIIQSKTKKETLHIFAQILTSTSSARISGNSLNKKYYNIDDHSAKVVKELILNLYKSFNADRIKK
ncbi:hypothetical protein [Saccharicrinis aurantiacus]|uniref:hypothetical protein n=1 Tax=Saccharicrinis aurantiacus TaxID=1849719 RepID=UPI002491E2CE|nr:hypothetical protein [Saccharicrinis aurantiacus]